MSALYRFGFYNVLPALAGGVIVWLFVGGAVRLLRIRQGTLRLCLFAAPLVKSTLLLIGIGLLMPWPRATTAAWHASALPPSRVLPWFLLFSGAGILVRAAAAGRARRAALAEARPADRVAPRMSAALDDVMKRIEKQCRSLLIERCGCQPPLLRPHLLAAGPEIRTPLIATDPPPTIVFPAALADQLDDTELRGALAHEVAHLQMRSHRSCLRPSFVRSLTTANPLALIMTSHLRTEEDKACDDVAVAATGDGGAYAGMLLKAYRFARPTSGTTSLTAGHLPGLLGIAPSLSKRIERLVQDPPPRSGMATQYAAFAVVWAAMIVLFFNA